MRSFPLTKSIAVAVLTASSVVLPSIPRSHAATIASVYSGGPGTYALTGTVTSVLSTSSTANTFILSDSTGSIIDYNVTKTSYTATVGDNISITTADVTYQGAPELTNTGFTLTMTNSTGNPVMPVALTIPQFVAAGTGSTTQTAVAPYAEALVTLNNVFLPAGTTSIGTKTSYTLTDSQGNTTTMYTYTTDSAVASAVTAANNSQAANSQFLSGPLSITGYVDVYYGVPELYPVAFAVPEPASCALTGLGGLGLVMVARRMRRVRLA